MAVASDAFEALARQTAGDLGFDDARLLVVAHPIGGVPEQTLEARAEAALDGVIAGLEAG